MKSFKQKVDGFIESPKVGVKKIFDYYIFQWLPFRVGIKFVQLNRIFQHRGFFRSVVNRMPVDGRNKPIPWFTYSATEYLRQLDLSERSVFEFGSGNSSLFFAEVAKKVVSVDDDKKWLDILMQNKPENHELVFASSKEEYISSIFNRDQKFDIILVDGNYRFECIKASIACLKAGGMIILDNSDWFPKTSEFLRENNLIEVDFCDMGPQNGFAWATSMYLHRDFNFKPLNGIQPSVVMGGVKGSID